MEQWEPHKKLDRGAGFKKYLYETFRPHGIDEYSAFFTRGLNGDKDKTGAEAEYTLYPFVYARVFVAVTLLFGLSAFILFITGNYISFPVVSLFGGLMVNLPLLVLAYELYPLKNLSLPYVAAVALLGGTAATLLIQLVYFVYIPANEIADAVYVGFSEEIFKALPVIAIISANKKRTPFFGLVAGFAVGAGMATIEDVGYIFNYGTDSYGVNYPMFATVTLTRGITAVCTHIIWTGLIGYAYAKFKNPLKNARFYAYAITCAVLHSLWDLPTDVIGEITSLAIYLVCAAVVLVLTVRAIRGEKKLINLALHPLYAANTQPEQLEMPLAIPAEPVAQPAKCAKKLLIANTVTGLCALVFAFCGIAACIISDRIIGYDYEVFDTEEEMLYYVQNGASFNVITDRKYQKTETGTGLSHENDYSYGYKNGKLVYATQRVIDKYEYFYDYSFEHSSDGLLTNVTVLYKGAYYEMKRTGNGYYFAINSNVYEVRYDRDSGRYYAELNNLAFYVGEIAVLAAVMALSLAGTAGGAAVMIIDKKNKNREETKC